MENQHKKIKGYRDLSQDEINLMNEVKQVEQKVLQLFNQVDMHLTVQKTEMTDGQEIKRFDMSQPGRWHSIARTQIEQGFMALVRAVAQPLNLANETDLKSFKNGDKVTVFDRYLFAIPLDAYIIGFNTAKDSAYIKLVTSNNHKFPIGHEMYVFFEQIKHRSD